jgi:hypothetical protein
MESPDAESPPAETEHTFVHSVASPTTEPSFARPKPDWPVVTPLRVERFRSALEEAGGLDEFLDVIHGLAYGFPMNSSLIVTSTRISHNYGSANEHPEVIDNMIATELAAGRLRGPFSQIELENLVGPFLTHPLGVVPKPNGKWRLVEDMSFPHDGSFPSLNSTIDISDVPVDWGGFKEMAEVVVGAPPGAQSATVDWGNAFRLCPVATSDLHLGAYSWPSMEHQEQIVKFYADLCWKFGNTRSTGVFGRVNKAFVFICRHKKWGIIIYWVDDLNFIRIPINFSPPWRYSFSLDDILELADYLGVPLPREKVREFSSLSRYFGLLWDLDAKTVSLPEEKRISIAEKLAHASSSPSISVKDLHSLAGSLSHASTVVAEGRVNLRGIWSMLTAMIKSGGSEFRRWKWSTSASRDITWWSSFLSTPHITMRLCTETVADDSFGIYTDASTSWGVSVVIGSEFDMFKLHENWRNWDDSPKDIGWAEFVAVELAVFFLLSSHRLRNRHVLIHVDNQGVVGAWNSRSSRNPAQNEVLGRILRMLLRAQCFLSMVYVPSGENPADLPSRGIAPPNMIRANWHGFPTRLRNVLTRA